MVGGCVDKQALALSAIRRGAQDCLVTSELDPPLLRRALTHAIELKRAESELVHQALHDQLTGLPNRALFLDRLGLALERSRRSGDPLAVLFLDFDNFKQINDSRGHAAGDHVLSTLGGRLSGLLRPMDKRRDRDGRRPEHGRGGDHPRSRRRDVPSQGAGAFAL
jgi:PleD family two-component response regulator